MKSNSHLTIQLSSQGFDEARALMQCALEGSASWAQRQRLAKLVCENPELRTQWLEQVRIDSLLRANADGFAQYNKPHAPAKKSFAFPTWAKWSAAAAALLLSISVWFFQQNGGAHMRVLQSANASEFTTGQSGNFEKIVLPEGNLRLSMNDGTILSLTAPACVSFEKNKVAFLEKGTLMLETPKNASNPWRVQTRQANVRGAANGVFGVYAGDKTDIAVFAESATVSNVNGDDFQLHAGEAIGLSDQAEASRIACIVRDINDVEWAWSPALTQATVISGVSDNLSNAEAFHRIAIGGMREGVPISYRADRYWFTSDGKEFPSWLENSDLLEPAAQASKQNDLLLNLSFSQPALVCVLFPLSAEKPNWLKESFEDSGVRLCARDINGNTTETFAVWKKNVTEIDASVYLGPADKSKGGIGYRVATKALFYPSVAANQSLKNKHSSLN